MGASRRHVLRRGVAGSRNGASDEEALEEAEADGAGLGLLLRAGGQAVRPGHLVQNEGQEFRVIRSVALTDGLLNDGLEGGVLRLEDGAAAVRDGELEREAHERGGNVRVAPARGGEETAPLVAPEGGDLALAEAGAAAQVRHAVDRVEAAAAEARERSPGTAELGDERVDHEDEQEDLDAAVVVGRDVVGHGLQETDPTACGGKGANGLTERHLHREEVAHHGAEARNVVEPIDIEALLVRDLLSQFEVLLGLLTALAGHGGLNTRRRRASSDPDGPLGALCLRLSLTPHIGADGGFGGAARLLLELAPLGSRLEAAGVYGHFFFFSLFFLLSSYSDILKQHLPIRFFFF